MHSEQRIGETFDPLLKLSATASSLFNGTFDLHSCIYPAAIMDMYLAESVRYM